MKTSTVINNSIYFVKFKFHLVNENLITTRRKKTRIQFKFHLVNENIQTLLNEFTAISFKFHLVNENPP